MSTFVLVHGAFHGGWVWERVSPLLRAAGHTVFTPTFTGLGELAHLLTPDISIETHVRDITDLLEREDLRAVILVAHSYGAFLLPAMVAQAAGRVARAVNLDALVFEDGDSFAARSPRAFAEFSALAQVHGDGWKVPPPPWSFGLTDEADLRWLRARLTPHPLRTFAEAVRYDPALFQSVPRTFVNFTDGLIPQDMPATREKLQRDGWDYHTLRTGHDAMLTEPRRLADLLMMLA